jgi:hypothetical protein
MKFLAHVASLHEAKYWSSRNEQMYHLQGNYRIYASSPGLTCLRRDRFFML